MDSDRWNRLLNLLNEALSMESTKRRIFITEACGDDEKLKGDLIRLIESSEEAAKIEYFEQLGKELNPFTNLGDGTLSGKTIDQYHVRHMIGKGGMGDVYLAFDTTLQRPVALKFLPDHLINNDEARKRFLIEARAAAALNHPNICTIYEIRDQERNPFIAMEFVPGTSIKALLKENLFDLIEALRLSIQICEGLEAAHSQSIIHRDIKPSNLMLNEQGRLIIMDFGIAKRKGTEDVSDTGTTRGTAAYMSPEQFRGQEIDVRSDLWSLGVVLFQMLTGTLPFDGRSEFELLDAILNTSPKRIEALRPEVPKELRTLVYKLLSKKAQDRYGSAHDVLLELRSLDSSMRLREQITRPDKNLPSIAVLPFVNMSPDVDNDYFCEGLAEELINGLCGLSELRVAARTSSFAFREKNLDAKEIGRQLNVDHLLEGSVRKSGNRLRITVQLIKIEDGYHLWSHKYDRILEDVFELQDELAMNVVETLKVKLLSNEEAWTLKPGTTNYEAYSIYLKGRFHWNRRTKQDLIKATEYARQSIAIDPSFANAYSCLSDSLIFSGLHGYQPGYKIYPEAQVAALNAIKNNPELSEAHTSLALTSVFCDLNWQQAEQASRKAIALNPQSPSVHSLFAGFVLGATGRFDESINEISIAQHKDPLSAGIHTAAGVIHWQANLLEKAFELANKAMDLNPRYWLSHALKGLIFEQWEKYDQAIQALQKAKELKGDTSSSLVLGKIGHTFAKAGKMKEAHAMLEEIDQVGILGYASPYDKALVYTGLGDHEQALHYLKQAIEERASWVVLINVDPRFAEVLKLDAFASIQTLMHFDEPGLESTR